ncbi:hypothetical protein OAK87_01400 [bacterium]|nr:hypothetical protein [bacterium]
MNSTNWETTTLNELISQLLQNEHEHARAYESGDAGMISYLRAEWDEINEGVEHKLDLIRRFQPEHPMAAKEPDMDRYILTERIKRTGYNRN